MAVSYDKLLHLLIDRQMSNAELIKRAGFSGNVMTQIKCIYIEIITPKLIHFNDCERAAA
ncbi:MAG TPA: hypothetical protein PK941_09690 [Paludibacter sp.]|nr:hypothetical protein [Paludibacter sp.]